MKTLVTIITLCFLSTISFGQDENLIYASMDDYLNNKPVPDYEIVNNSYSKILGTTTFKVKHAGETTRLSISKMPGEFFTYVDDTYSEVRYSKILMRIYEGDPYMVLLNGPISFYSMYMYSAKLFYSETIKGELKGYKKKVLEKYLKEYNLLDSYKKDHPKVHVNTTPNERFNNNVQHDIKYFKIINSKLKP